MEKKEDMIPYGTAFINGYRIVFNAYKFKKGKDKGKIECYYRKGNMFKKIILNENEITVDKDKFS
jgi:hypothetical protein